MRQRPFIAISLLLLAQRLLAVGRAQPATAPSPRPASDEQPFVGAWRVKIFEDDAPPAHALFTLGADGTLVAAEHPIATPPGAGLIFTSSGHGGWRADGPDSVVLSFVALGSHASGALFGAATIRVGLALEPDRQTAAGPFDATIADPDDTPLAAFTGTVRATRITVEAPAAR